MMRHILRMSLICALLSGTSYAMQIGMGPYLGLQVGGAKTHYTLSMLGLQNGKTHYEGVAERVFLGYQLNANLGFEFGAIHFTPSRVQDINGSMKNARIKDYNVDFLLAANLAFNNGYYIFGKFGFGYHMAEPGKSIQAVSITDYANSRVRHYRPEMMVGLGYALTHKIGLDASYTQIIRERMLPQASLWALGVTYRFQDFYPCKTLFG